MVGDADQNTAFLCGLLLYSKVLLFSVWSAVPVGVQKTHPRIGNWVPSSQAWLWAKVLSISQLMFFSSYLPVKASGARGGWYEWGRGRSNHPLPWAFWDIIAVILSPSLSKGASKWMGSFVFRQWGWICLSDQVSRRASAQQKTPWMNTTCPRWNFWMLSVPGEHRLTSFSGWVEGGLLCMSTPCSFRSLL